VCERVWTEHLFRQREFRLTAHSARVKESLDGLDCLFRERDLDGPEDVLCARERKIRRTAFRLVAFLVNALLDDPRNWCLRLFLHVMQFLRLNCPLDLRCTVSFVDCHHLQPLDSTQRSFTLQDKASTSRACPRSSTLLNSRR